MKKIAENPADPVDDTGQAAPSRAKRRWATLSLLIGMVCLSGWLVETRLFRPARMLVAEFVDSGLDAGRLEPFRGRKLTYLPLGRIPPDVLMLILAAEDDRFLKHYGCDPREMTRAALTNIRAGKIVRGAGTVTMQLARLLWLTNERTFTRKLKELALAFELERRLSKMQILELYLNLSTWGYGVVGIEQAARRYFGLGAARLSFAQGAILAVILPNPEKFNPFVNRELVAKRAETLLARLLRERRIDQGAYDSAIEETEALFGFPAAETEPP